MDLEFEDFFVAHYERLVRSLTAITGDQEIASDVVQEALIKASARWRKVRKLESPVGWTLRVAINSSRDLHRSNSRRHRRELRAAQADIILDEESHVDDFLGLAKLLQQLPLRQRAVASLFYIEDLPVAEIADILDISDNTVKSHLKRARQTLRAALEYEGRPHG